ncbi:DUF2878 domain-containing protein [Alteromonas sp. 1_MG-2023]|uniref:DUF2878 domain-containing protein n=1 Tax=Alteromonas sp. 1_MG-2023 TaxID=3062669 RepID=UPI0026E434D7|nr:DUF2878 domain-containing protein [Alteromonas sp. 1_MG-2023]MDO6568095.1 DUF2878 domain-containing protein [Alteromonas sp. 1_MG-2023]
MPNSFLSKLLNFFWFQGIWWLVVLYQSTFITLCVVMCLLGAWIVFSPIRKSDFKIMVSVLLLGTLVDSLLMITGVFGFETGAWLRGSATHLVIPIWLMFLWAALGGSIQHSLSAFANRPWLAAIGGAIFAPVSYFGGEAFGAVTFGYSSTITFIILAIVWAFVFPLCFVVAGLIADSDNNEQPN